MKWLLSGAILPQSASTENEIFTFQLRYSQSPFTVEHGYFLNTHTLARWQMLHCSSEVNSGDVLTLRPADRSVGAGKAAY